ncbi:uncharacterized protein LOC112089091 [Eutrema salsugineum]|uniref:uncharacterized protein LOC112089091 n=1 Tax=Eutrema salsugineum TaxID=72664 RepID=UPI000CED6B8E|nr:uncharacterized protein LOC112089091 [Eutrema salsugineum]
MSSTKEKEIWEALQGLSIGSDGETWRVHQDAQQQFTKDHRLCLVARGLNPDHQKPAGIKAMLPKAWLLEDMVESQIKDDGTVNFYFEKEHQMLNVLEKGPYHHKGWMVALDKWGYRSYPTFLKHIPFWIRIKNLPAVYRREGIVKSIGSRLGQVDKVLIIQPTINRAADVRVKVDFDVDSEITLARRVQILDRGDPVDLQFRYIGLQKFCTTCGSLKHSFDMCNKPISLTPNTEALMSIGNNPYLAVKERMEAITVLKAIKEVGENSGTQQNQPLLLPHAGDTRMDESRTAAQDDHHMGQKRNESTTDVEVTSQGVKRRSDDVVFMEESSSKKAAGTVDTAKGLVVSLKPPQQP